MTSQLSTVTIRRLEERDLAPLAHAFRFSRHHIEGRWRERRAGARTMLIAEQDGGATGSVSMEERGDFPGYLYLYALAVLEPLQCRGTGTRLIAAVEEEARARGLRGVYLSVAIGNAGARRLYERLGYARTGAPFTSRWTWEGSQGETREIVEECVRMVKRFQAP
jgi:ribosomal protein S18 acetylase RimI-like enzyme